LAEPFPGLDDRAVTIVTNRLKQSAHGGAIVILATMIGAGWLWYRANQR